MTLGPVDRIQLECVWVYCNGQLRCNPSGRLQSLAVFLHIISTMSFLHRKDIDFDLLELTDSISFSVPPSRGHNNDEAPPPIVLFHLHNRQHS